MSEENVEIVERTQRLCAAYNRRDWDDVGEWRAAHERFWSEEVIPRLPPGWASPLTDDTEVVVERFRLVE